jgi:hypothetical protein
MDKLVIDGETWGRIMMGKAGTVPSYRKEVDGKMVAVKTVLVPQEVKDAFDGHFATAIVSPVEPAQVDDFGFSGVDEDPTELPPEDPLDKLTLKDFAEALYRRFGIYTCYLMREPNNKDIHPVTGNLMNNFTLGQTRNQYLVARRSGANYNPEVMKSILGQREQSSFDFQAHFAQHPDRFEQPVLEGQEQMSMQEYRELRAKQSKPIMETERGRFDDGSDPDELYAEPPINGRTIIRPYYSSPSAERRLREKREQRGEF